MVQVFYFYNVETNKMRLFTIYAMLTGSSFYSSVSKEAHQKSIHPFCWKQKLAIIFTQSTESLDVRMQEIILENFKQFLK